MGLVQFIKNLLVGIVLVLVCPFLWIVALFEFASGRETTAYIMWFVGLISFLAGAYMIKKGWNQ